VTQAHYVEQLAHKWPGDLTIQKIDTDTEPDKARQYGVFTLPTTILVDKMGEVRQVNYGLTNSNKLAQQLHSL
jgi:thioredoxin-like negative regulator of GroEL